MKKIAVIRTQFSEKFGIPRQSGLVKELKAQIIFEPEYREKEALRGLEGFSHIWLIWEFSKAKREKWSPTVRPPRLGGNKRLGVFATRSPFRPNPIGLSCVKLEDISYSETDGPVITVSGADLLDNTPIYDIKPYLPYADCIENATGGFTDTTEKKCLEVVFVSDFNNVNEETLKTLKAVLGQDPRPSYQNDPERISNLSFDKNEVKLKVENGILTVVDIT
jgi:tRNA-Thr(GGU) m(6)t(6)A37 methyltransferase TsaA